MRRLALLLGLAVTLPLAGCSAYDDKSCDELLIMARGQGDAQAASLYDQQCPNVP